MNGDAARLFFNSCHTVLIFLLFSRHIAINIPHTFFFLSEILYSATVMQPSEGIIDRINVELLTPGKWMEKPEGLSCARIGKSKVLGLGGCEAQSPGDPAHWTT